MRNISHSNVNTPTLQEWSPCSAERRHLASEERAAGGGLFTSGIKSAHDIETSGWMKLSQGAGTGAGMAPTTQARKTNRCYKRAKSV